STTACCATSGSAVPTSCARPTSPAGATSGHPPHAPPFVGAWGDDILRAPPSRSLAGIKEIAELELPIDQVDAFASRLFAGNPAAVCPREEWLPAPTMQAIAAENNLAETAFYVPASGDYELRWFTPTTEVSLCGHATLATAFVISGYTEPGRNMMRFHT